MGTDKTRREKQMWFEQMFKVAKEREEVISKQKLLPLFALACFSTTETGEDILRLYKSAGIIKIEGDEIIIN